MPTSAFSPSFVTRRAFVAGAAGTITAAAAASALPRIARAQDAPASEVVIYHTNDTHGYLEGDGESVVGIDLVAGLKAATPNSLLVDAGDATQGAPLASLTQGSSPIDLMNAAGYDAMCLGNHEFDFGLDVLRANAAAAQFPLLSANAQMLDGSGAVLDGAGEGDGCACVLEAGGRRIGVFGLTTTATAWSVTPAYVADVTFADEVQTAEQQIAALAEQGVDAIVCLAHMGDGTVPVQAVELAERLSPEAAALLTAIVDGHSHTVENTQVNGVLVVQTGCYLANVGKLVLAFADDGSVTVTDELLDPAAVAALVEPSAQVAAELQEVIDDQAQILSVEVCDNSTTLWGGKLNSDDVGAPTRAVETNFGDLACEALRVAACDYVAQLDDSSLPVVAVENGGGIRASLPRGTVVKGDLVTAFPFSNTVMAKTVTPSLLYQFFEAAYDAMDGQDAATGMLLQTSVSGAFAQVAGCTVTVDPNAEAGGRVVSIVLDGTAEALDPADDESLVVLASNSYVMTGGGFEPLGDVALLAELGGELEAVEAHLAELVAANDGASLPSMPGAAGNIVLAGGYEPAPWLCTLHLVDAAGEPVPNQAVTLQVDAAELVSAQSDEDGLVAVELEDGPHAVAVVAAGDADEAPFALVEAYVNNYMGIGLVEDEHRSAVTVELPEA